MSTTKRFVRLFQELWYINPYITIAGILIVLFFVFKFLRGFVNLFRSDSSSKSTYKYSPKEIARMEREDRKRTQREEDIFSLLVVRELIKNNRPVHSYHFNKHREEDDDEEEQDT